MFRPFSGINVSSRRSSASRSPRKQGLHLRSSGIRIGPDNAQSNDIHQFYYVSRFVIARAEKYQGHVSFPVCRSHSLHLKPLLKLIASIDAHHVYPDWGICLQVFSDEARWKRLVFLLTGRNRYLVMCSSASFNFLAIGMLVPLSNMIAETGVGSAHTYESAK